MSWDSKAFQEKLDDQHSFPGEYIFKFIVPSESVAVVEKLWTKGVITKKPSSKGKYTSVTIKGQMQTSDDVIQVYEQAHQIKGIVAL